MAFFFSASARLASDAVIEYLGVEVGFVMYLCFKYTVPYILCACVLFTHRFQHR